MQHLGHSLSATQLLYAEYCANPFETRSQEDIAQEIGVTRETLWRWRRIKGFGEFVFSLSLLHVKSDLSQILGALSKKASEGNTQAARLVFEVTGILQAPTSRNIFNEDCYTGYLDLNEDISKTVQSAWAELSKSEVKILREAIRRINKELVDWAIVTEDVTVNETTELQVIENALAQ